MKDTQEAYDEIMDEIVPEVLELFQKKNKDYNDGPSFQLLGSKGQFADINRKIWKLYKGMWKGEPLVGEQPEEILMDLIGHCLLSIYCLRVEASENLARINELKAAIQGTQAL